MKMERLNGKKKLGQKDMAMGLNQLELHQMDIYLFLHIIMMKKKWGMIGFKFLI